ncbi:MAG: 2-oxo acid dehydrogenase subunit E2 [Phycisphaerae bacterium]|nr:2-oxo acid dehydrogenase subunit E2 [Phycisphaerae bacterium]
MAIEFKLPDLGENIEAGDVVNVLVAEGDTIEAGQNVLEIETDKAVVELPCPHAGRVAKIHIKVGDRVPVGAAVLTIDKAGGAAAPAAAAAPAVAEAEAEEAPEKPESPTQATPARKPPTAPAKPAAAEASSPVPTVERATRAAPGAVAAASPAVRRLARELGVDLHQVEGTAPGNRITADDVKRFIRESLSAAPAPSVAAPGIPALPDFTKWGPVERRPLRGIRRKAAENLSIAWQVAPHVTQFDLADITELEAARKQYVANKRAMAAKAKDAGRESAAVPPLTMTVLVMKAVVKVLQQYPQFNASLDFAAGELIIKQYYHLGVAVDTEQGLIVPVVRDVDQKDILQIAAEVNELAERARARKIDLEELRGGTFTISNLGGLGGTGFTPILNYPEVAILGIARSRQEQVVIDGQPRVRTILPLCLSYDHRVIDGADGVRFLSDVAALLADPFAMFLDA